MALAPQVPVVVIVCIGVALVRAAEVEDKAAAVGGWGGEGRNHRRFVGLEQAWAALDCAAKLGVATVTPITVFDSCFCWKPPI
jgi:hypothetical protein